MQARLINQLKWLSQICKPTWFFIFFSIIGGTCVWRNLDYFQPLPNEHPVPKSYNNVKISTNIFGIFWKINSRQGDEKDKLQRLAKTNIQATGLNF